MPTATQLVVPSSFTTAHVSVGGHVPGPVAASIAPRSVQELTGMHTGTRSPSDTTAWTSQNVGFAAESHAEFPAQQ
jgi:hypothetical protein